MAAPSVMEKDTLAVVVAPVPSANRQDAQGAVSRQSIATNVLKMHAAGLQARRQRDLISEKLLLHIDGSGEGQYADIYYGMRVEIPRDVTGYRQQQNLLRPIVDNAISHHVSMPLRYFADSLPDRKSRDKAIMDTLWANYLAQQQDLNALFSDALYLAMPAGFCPVHGYWRDGNSDAYAVPGPEGNALMPQPGMIDCWVGNPFDTVFDPNAIRGSIRWATYGRVLPADLVRTLYPQAKNLEGTTKIPSAAQFQRIARDWQMAGLGVHGSPVMNSRRGGEESMIVVCREVLPGVEADWPNGRFQMIAVPGAVDLRRNEGAGHAELLVDQELPAGDFSFTNFYSHHRGDDVHGKPWVEDLDELQVELNIALSKHWELTEKMAQAPIVGPGGAMDEDTMEIDGLTFLEIEPSLANWRPRQIELSSPALASYERKIDQLRNAMYTLGGYQASSRGEAPGSRMAYRAILALQQADNTVHGPVNRRFVSSACDFMQLGWKQFKVYGDVPWMVSIVGDEYAYLAEPYIDRMKVSDAPPHYRLVNAFGASPELRAQEIIDLSQVKGADGEPFLTTQQARRQYPNPLIFTNDLDPKAVQVRRAKAIASEIQNVVRKFREQTQFDKQDIADPWVQQAAQLVFKQMEAQYPRLRDDDLMSHLAALSEVTQDESADVIARLAARARQTLYFDWQAMQAGVPAGPTPGAPGAPAGAPAIGLAPDRMAVAAQMMRGAAGPGEQQEPAGPPPITATARG